jgi:hypothetical protein
MPSAHRRICLIRALKDGHPVNFRPLLRNIKQSEQLHYSQYSRAAENTELNY